MMMMMITAMMMMVVVVQQYHTIFGTVLLAGSTFQSNRLFWTWFLSSASAVWKSLSETVLGSASMTVFKCRLKPTCFISLVILDSNDVTSPVLPVLPVKLWHGRTGIIDHLRSSMVYNFGHVCMYVCLSVDNFRKPWRRKFVYCTCGISPWFTGRVCIWRSSGQGQGHRSQKGKKNPYSRNIKLQLAVAPVL